MKTLVLGGGIVGVTTAYFLAKAGHEVTLVEEKGALGLEATAGNAGIIAPGHSFAWASPRAPRMLWQSLRGAETAIRVRLTTDPRLYAWGLRFLRECTAARARRNTLIKLRLCQYSQAVLNELVRAEGIEYHAITKGALYLHRDPAELEAGVKKMALLAEHGQRQEILDANALARLEPAFEPVKGYSSTFPLKRDGLAPTISGVDEQWLVGWSRLGDRLRLTSTAEFAGYEWGWTPRDFNNILRLARDLFPTAADYERGEYRACLRPMTPDGPPILGLGRHRNLFFNCGHGHMGWTMACGTARIVADLMIGRMPDLDLQGLTVRR